MGTKTTNIKLNNPFTPSFGQVPRNIAGRSEITSQLENAVDNAPGDPAVTTILIGARGTGKTALLTFIADIVEQKGWISVNVSCIKGLLDDIYIQALRKTEHLIHSKSKIKELSIKAGPVEVGLEMKEQETISNWRTRMTDILDEIENHDAGLLITIDEVNTSLDEMVEFASVYQMFIREERKIALFMAGLPYHVSLLLKNKSISFLRRANQQYLSNIPDYEIRDAIRKTVEDGGKGITEEALDEAVQAVGGFPFMLQLVGYRAFHAGNKKTIIGIEEIRSGVKMAEEDLKLRILKSTLDEISDMGIVFLKAMLMDEKSSAPADIAIRLEKSSSYISTYKKRLMEHGVIMPAERNRIQFALPFLREYLQEYI